MTRAEACRVLNVAPNVDGDALKAAYRAAALRTHPDRGGIESDFRRAREAFDVLSGNAPASAPPPAPPPRPSVLGKIIRDPNTWQVIARAVAAETTGQIRDVAIRIDRQIEEFKRTT